ncbi:MAG: hypothetical protein M1835_004838 [Candelina submexicana]|nr:MAG: hypothetical protein M1835_004838 [Candelina submexicana]
MLSKATIALLITSAFAVPHPLPQPSEYGRIEARDDGGINGGWFGQNDGIGAAVQAAPVFMFGADHGISPWKNKAPCIPEGAGNSKGDGPNPGTNPTPSGDDCRNPSHYEGPFTKADPFPVYFSVVWCGLKGEWRINYDLYFSHDVGHKNDWESVTMTFHEHVPGSNIFYRDYVMLSQHSKKVQKAYKDVQSVNMVDGDNDVRPLDGRNKLHPKVYVGTWHHSMYFDGAHKADRSLALTNGEEYELRGDDWWYLPVESDIIKSGTLDAYKHQYGSADSDPAKIRDEICGFAPS